MKLNEEDQKDYNKYLKHLHEVASGNYNEMVDVQDLINQGVEKGEEKKEIEVVLEMHKDDVPVKTIAKYLKISEDKVLQIIKNKSSK